MSIAIGNIPPIVFQGMAEFQGFAQGRVLLSLLAVLVLLLRIGSVWVDENSLISRRIKLNKPQMYLFPVKRVVK